MAKPCDMISDAYTIDDIDQALDRVAEEIEANPDGQCLIPLFQWLEEQLEMRQRRRSTMDAVRTRLAKKGAK